jgi:hypothetical protein
MQKLLRNFRTQTVRRWKPRHHGVAFNESRERDEKASPAPRFLQRLERALVKLVLAQESGDDDTTIDRDHRRRSRTDAVASRTVSLLNTPLSWTGTAIRIRPFRTTRTSRGAGSISTRPSRKAIRRGIPGSSFAWSRISLGRTNRPAESMVEIAPGFMAKSYHSITSPSAQSSH